MWESLRKFGLEYCDLPTITWNVSIMLRVLTLNIDPRNKKPIPKIFYIITLTVAACYFYVYLISMLWFVFWKCRETGDFTAAIIVLSLGITSEIGTAKLIFMMIYRYKIRKIVELYLECDSQVKPGSRFFLNMMKALRNVKKRAMIFWLVIIGNGVVYIVKPAVTPGKHLMEDVFTLYGLEPSTESPNHEISFLLMSLGTVHTCYIPANISAFLIIAIGYNEAQMLALSEEVLNIWNDALRYLDDHTITDISVNSNDQLSTVYQTRSENINKHDIINEFIETRLREIVKIHVTNINLVQQMEQVLRGAIVVEFILLIIGLILELLCGLEKTYIQVPFALMQVAMDCWAGQRLVDASIMFEKSVYACKWENFNLKNMKTVLLVSVLSQKTMTLSAGGVTKLSFSSLMMVLRSIYSAYTALRPTMS
ncbi:hypothetical protein evm_008223 [Chilo suppressalis]|nr:hypothetical protein evm_008223 [Chilo suppressalis]